MSLSITKRYVFFLLDLIIMCNSPALQSVFTRGHSEKFAVAQSQPRSHGCICNVAAGEHLLPKQTEFPVNIGSHQSANTGGCLQLPDSSLQVATNQQQFKRLTGDAAMKLHLMLHFIVSESHYKSLFCSSEAFYFAAATFSRPLQWFIWFWFLSLLFVWSLCHRPCLIPPL